MSFAVNPIPSTGTTHYSKSAARFSGAHAAFGHDDHNSGDLVSFAGAQSANTGTNANFGIITGLLACCAVVPFMVGMLAMGGIALAASRAVKGVRSIHLPQVV